MEVKLVCWNMQRRNLDTTKDAWDFLYNEIGADIVLATEMRDPKDICPYKYHNWLGILGAGRTPLCGTGIVSKFELQSCHCESAAVGSKVLELDLVLISMYGLKDEEIKTSSGVTNIHRYLSDLTPLLTQEKKFAGKGFILGGDFNADLKLDGTAGYTPNSNKILFDRIRDLGLEDCLDEPKCTWRTHSGSEFQLDHLYASPNIKKVCNAEVLDNARVRELSDHNPIIAKFEF